MDADGVDADDVSDVDGVCRMRMRVDVNGISKKNKEKRKFTYSNADDRGGYRW